VKPALKVPVIAGGYVAAFLLAFAAVAIRVATTSGPDAQASSGMYAFGDALLFVAVFAVTALAPTGAALFLLRPYPRFWAVLSTLGFAVAVTGVTAAKGLRIGVAAGPDRAFLQLLRESGVDPKRDGVQIAPVPGANDPGVSFGVFVAEALERGGIDGFWANALGSETAVRCGVGKIVVDVRRGDGPPDAGHYTFAALVTSDAVIAREPERVAGAVRAIVRAQKILKADPSRATEIGRRRFPSASADIIAAVVERDPPFYDPAISEASVTSMNAFAQAIGALSMPVAYDAVVATRFRSLWTT